MKFYITLDLYTIFLTQFICIVFYSFTQKWNGSYIILTPNIYRPLFNFTTSDIIFTVIIKQPTYKFCLDQISRETKCTIISTQPIDIQTLLSYCTKKICLYVQTRLKNCFINTSMYFSMFSLLLTIKTENTYLVEPVT